MLKRLPGFNAFLRSWLTPTGIDDGAAAGHVSGTLLKMLFLFVIIVAGAHAQNVGL